MKLKFTFNFSIEVQHWFIGETGQTCNDACSAIGRSCIAGHMSIITSEELMKEKVKEAGYTCKTIVGHRGYAGSPIYRRSQEDCFYLTPGKTAVCNEIKYPSGNSALCYCDCKH